jgi:hypothetical protein
MLSARGSPSATIAVSGSGFTVEVGAGYGQLQFLSGAIDETVVLQAGGTDEISGFNPNAGDVLDLCTLIAGSNLDLAAVSASIGAYVTVSDQGTRACHQLSQTTLATSWTAARKFRAVFS